MNAPANRYRAEHSAVDAAGNILSGQGQHELATTLWAAAATLKVLGKPVDLTELRKVITKAADAYATEHDHVVVLDDVVADSVALAVRDWFGGAR